MQGALVRALTADAASVVGGMPAMVFYAKCPYHSVLYMQSVLVIHCFICKMYPLFSALYAKCPHYSVLNMQGVLLIQGSTLSECAPHSQDATATAAARDKLPDCIVAPMDPH